MDFAPYADENLDGLLVDRSDLPAEPEWILEHLSPLLARAEFHVARG